MSPRAEQTGRPASAVFDIALYGLSQVLQGVIALALMGVIARGLGPDGFGEFSFLFALGLLLGLVAEFGLGPWLSRTVAQTPDARSQALQAALSVRLRLLGLWCLLVAGVAGFYLRDVSRSIDFFTVAVYSALIGQVVVFESFLMGLRRVGRVSVTMLAGRLVELFAVLVGVWLGYASTVFAVGCAISIGAAIRLGLLWIFMRPFHTRSGARDESPQPERFESWRVVREVLPFAAATAIWAAYMRADVLILERVATPLALGLYTAAYRLVEALLMVPRSIVGVLAPVLSRAWAESRLDAPLLAAPARGLLVVAAGAAGGILALSADIMTFLFGSGFASGAVALQILGLGLVPMFLNQFLGIVYTASHRQREWSAFLAAGLALNLAANLLLIPRFGYTAAAWVRSGTEAMLLFALTVGLLRQTGFGVPLGWSVRLLLAVAGMYFVVGQVAIPFVWRVVLGAAAYLVLVAALRLVRGSEWALAVRSLRSGLASSMARN